MRVKVLYSIGICRLSLFEQKSEMCSIRISTFLQSMSFSTSSSFSSFKTLLSADECISLHGSPNVKFIDGSWYVEKTRDPRIEFLSERIPGSVFFDMEGISDKLNPLPHMLPSATIFEEEVSNLGISSNDHIIVYTKQDCFSASRVWWTFKVFGHNRISILNGGMNAWKKKNGKIEVGALPTIKRRNFKATRNSNLVVDWKEILDVVNTGKAQIVDARSSARFKAEVPEPRPGLARGHIPGSLNIPFTMIVKEDDYTTFRPVEEIRDAFINAGVVLGSKTMLTCGTGVTAAVLGFGLHLLGKDMESFPIYDGSWSEWGKRDDLPKVN